MAGGNPWVFCLGTYDSGSGPALYAGGTFSSAGGHAANGIAKWASGGSPAITQQPSVQSVTAGRTAMFSAGASGSTSYRWRHDGVALPDGGRIMGAGTPTLSISQVRASDAGFSDMAASSTSGSAT